MPLVTHLISIMLLFCLQRDTHARANTHILRNTARSQAYSRLMVNAWNVSVPYQTASILAVDVISLSRAVGAVFKICDENNWEKVTVQFYCCFFFIVYQKSPCLHCASSSLSVHGACAAENKIIFSIFSSVFLVLSSADPWTAPAWTAKRAPETAAVRGCEARAEHRRRDS